MDSQTVFQGIAEDSCRDNILATHQIARPNSSIAGPLEQSLLQCCPNDDSNLNLSIHRVTSMTITRLKLTDGQHVEGA